MRGGGAEVVTATPPRAAPPAPDRLIGQLAPATTTQWLHVDHLGSTRVVTDESGAVVSKHKYLPFGEEYRSFGAPATNSHKFTGHERDAETGLDYMMARYYGNGLGRFLSVDPGDDTQLEAPQSWNKYTYVRNAPLNANDPDGRAFNLVTGGIGAAVGGLVGGAWEAGRQYFAGEEFDGQKVLASAASGAISGGVAGLTGGTSFIVSAVSNVAGGVVERAFDGDASTSALAPNDMVLDVAGGFAGDKVGEAVGNAATKAVKSSQDYKVRLDHADSRVRAVQNRSESRQVSSRTGLARVQQEPVRAGVAAAAASGEVTSRAVTQPGPNERDDP